MNTSPRLHYQQVIMPVYIALIRAINVGGHRKIKMTDLCGMFTAMGMENVRNYIQSGNIIFSSAVSDTKRLETAIESEIEQVFGFDVSVMIRTIKQFERLVKVNPFDGKDNEPYMLYVTFFKEQPSAEKVIELERFSTDAEQFRFESGELYSLIDKKTGQKEIFSNNFVEKITGIPGTTRNWNSVNKILGIAQGDLQSK